MSSAPDADRVPDTGPVPEAVPEGPSGTTGDVSSVVARPAAAAGLVFDDPLDRPSADDTDRGWGESFSGTGTADDDFTRFLNEKPPHHL